MPFWIEDNLYWASAIALGLVCLAILFFALRAGYYAYGMIFRGQEEKIIGLNFIKSAFMAFTVFEVWFLVEWMWR